MIFFSWPGLFFGDTPTPSFSPSLPLPDFPEKNGKGIKWKLKRERGGPLLFFLPSFVGNREEEV